MRNEKVYEWLKDRGLPRKNLRRLLMLLDGVMYVKDGRKRYERDNS